MAYEYEESNTNTVSVMWKHDARVARLDELKEVYAKAKAFDEIEEVFKDSTLDDEIVMQTIVKNLRKLEDTKNE